MRKFKHKKLGWIATKSNSEEYVTSFIDELGGKTEVEIPLAMFSSSSDWEEVIEKDFDDIIYYKDSNGVEIISLKYLPTNKVWSLNDKTQFGTIEKFDIKDNKCYAKVNYLYGMFWNRPIELSELTEPKEEKPCRLKNFKEWLMWYDKNCMEALKKSFEKEEVCYPKGIVSFKADGFEYKIKSNDYNEYCKFVKYWLDAKYSIYKVTNGTDTFKLGDSFVFYKSDTTKKILSFGIKNNLLIVNYNNTWAYVSKIIKLKEQPTVKVNYEQPKKETVEQISYLIDNLINGKTRINIDYAEWVNLKNTETDFNIFKNDILELQKEANTIWADSYCKLKQLVHKINKLATK